MMFSFLFQKKPDKAKINTLFFLTKRYFKEIYACTDIEADHYATCKIGEWIEYNEIETRLKQIWSKKMKIA